MVATENLANTMHYFGNLSEAERALFLSVVSPKKETQKKTKKRKKIELPNEYSEDSFYNDLVKNHNRKVEMRLSKIKGHSK
ncbi:hypothetical protein [uncultured Tenacibaculum sp.]|uniref:hypothetical protein n=1 Tax=uncultured Tenacibaculum sp. TaxID=174713 RepID=UPI00262E2667|nr:hypothetical protein [uncultured Tenacibaculum sp.]